MRCENVPQKGINCTWGVGVHIAKECSGRIQRPKKVLTVCRELQGGEREKDPGKHLLERTRPAATLVMGAEMRIPVKVKTQASCKLEASGSRKRRSTLEN